MRTIELFVCACKDKDRCKSSWKCHINIFTLENRPISIRNIFTTEFCFLSNRKWKGLISFPFQNILIFFWGLFCPTYFFSLDGNWNFLYQLMGRTLLPSFFDHSDNCSWDKKGFTRVRSPPPCNHYSGNNFNTSIDLCLYWNMHLKLSRCFHSFLERSVFLDWRLQKTRV